MNKNLIIGLIAVLVIAGLNFLMTAAVVRFLCWCFSVTFSLKITLGCWLIVNILQFLFFGGKKE